MTAAQLNSLPSTGHIAQAQVDVAALERTVLASAALDLLPEVCARAHEHDVLWRSVIEERPADAMARKLLAYGQAYPQHRSATLPGLGRVTVFFGSAKEAVAISHRLPCPVSFADIVAAAQACDDAGALELPRYTYAMSQRAADVRLAQAIRSVPAHGSEAWTEFRPPHQVVLHTGAAVIGTSAARPGQTTVCTHDGLVAVLHVAPVVASAVRVDDKVPPDTPAPARARRSCMHSDRLTALAAIWKMGVHSAPLLRAKCRNV